jgi:hypothetical protein
MSLWAAPVSRRQLHSHLAEFAQYQLSGLHLPLGRLSWLVSGLSQMNPPPDPPKQEQPRASLRQLRKPPNSTFACNTLLYQELDIAIPSSKTQDYLVRLLGPSFDLAII